MDIEQLAAPTHNKKESDRKPESLQFQVEILPRRLCSEGNDAHPKETRAPANVLKQGYAGRPGPAPPAAAVVPPLPATVTALFLFWDAPPIAAGADHVLSDLLKGCAATHAVPGLDGKAVVLSHETLLAARPDLVFTTDGRVLVYRDSDGAMERFVAVPTGEDERRALQAAQRPGPRLHQARAAVCRRIANSIYHPPP